MSSLEWIKDVVYLMPVAGLIWKAATLSSKVRQNEQDIKEIKTDTAKSSDEILKKLDVISDKLNFMQIDIAILKDFKNTEERKKRSRNEISANNGS